MSSTNEEKAQELSMYVIQEKLPDGSKGLNMLTRHNKYAGDIDNIYDIAKQCALEMAKYKDSQLSGTLVNVDEVREDFMNTVYSTLSDDPTNDRANSIINAFDSLPKTSNGITAQLLKECADLINSTCYEEGTGISDEDIEYTIKTRRLK